MQKRVVCALLFLIMILGMFPITVPGKAASVNGLTYEIADGQVTIKGCTASISGELVIPDSIEGYPVTAIGGYAFHGCSGLTSVTIPDSVTIMYEGAFGGCTGIADVHISDLGQWCKIMFYSRDANPLHGGADIYINGDKITKLVIPEGVTKINGYAFIGCTSLVDVTIPSSVTNIGKIAFDNCTGLRYNIYDSGKYLGNENNPYIALLSATDTNISGIDIHPNTKVIGTNAFTGCTKLKCITIPDHVTSLCSAVFSGCSGLTEVILPNGITKIETMMFNGCKSLTQVTIPDGVTAIENMAFESCKGLNSVTIPPSVTKVGYGAFNNCSGLTQVHISDLGAWCNIDFSSQSSNPLSPGAALYMQGIKQTTLIIPEGTTAIKPYVFCGYKSLTDVTINDGVTSLGEYAFYRCTRLAKVTLSDSVNDIGDSAFSDCTSLKKVTVPGGVSKIGNSAFFRCTGLSSVTIANGVTTIGDSAFADCSSLVDLALPSSVAMIGSSAFLRCTGLTGVTISACVTDIENYAFAGCTGISTISFVGNAPQIKDRTFGDVTAQVCYPGDDTTWTEAVRQNYGGTLTWKPHSIKLPDHDNTTCTTDGTKSGSCEYCGEYISVAQSAYGHSFTHYTSNNNATCTADGTKSAKCDRCEVTDTVVDSGSAGHWFTNYISNENYTCTIDGTKTAKCDRCNATDTVVDVGSADHRYINGRCIFCDEENPCWIGATVSGAVISHGAGEVTLTFTPSCETIPTAVLMISGAEYTVDLDPGEYVVGVSQKGSVSRTYRLQLTEGDNTLELKLHQYGDVNGDGNLNMGDVAKAYAHSKKTNYLRDEYQRQCADFNGDGRIDVGDVAKFYALAKVKS